MVGSTYDPAHRPRELRRRVVLPARIRSGGCWSDACILNISSRGLMIQASRTVEPGAMVEITRGAHVIAGRVVWREGARAGLQVDSGLPVDEILTLSKEPRLQLTAIDSRLVERRRKPRSHEQSRVQARLSEFTGIAVIAGALCLAASEMLEHAFARPLAAIETALHGSTKPVSDQ